mgnify:FL=1|tara:strand:+ start:3338 stop:4186 length:849 start_codon:yes stop_codon:yes gene_type:complete
MKRILLTGASGFVGSYFFKNYKKTYHIKKFSFLNDNFNDLELNSIETIVHCSALVHQMKEAKKEHYYDINVNQTIELAKKAKDSGVKHFIFLSTVKVYGEECKFPYFEDSPTNPKDHYSASKLEAEMLLSKLETDNFKTSVVRSPLIYGNGVKANFFNLISLVKKTPILPFKDTKNKRSIVFVGNICFVLHKIISLEKQGVFIAKDNESLSTSELILMIGESLNKKIFLIKIPFFEKLLKNFLPSFYDRLYGSLFFNNEASMRQLHIEKNKFSTYDGLKEIN